MTERATGDRGLWPGLGLAVTLAMLGVALGAAAALLGRWNGVEALVPALVFCGGLSAGSLVLLLVHGLTGGQWGEDLRPPLLAAAAALPLVALLALPLLLFVVWPGLGHVEPELYPWAAEAQGGGTNPAYWYLNPPAFMARTLAVLVLWLIVAWSVGAYARRSTSPPGIGASAFSLVLMVLSMTLFAFDWAMSLDPAWYSAVFGLLVGVAQTLAAMALASLWLGLHRRRTAVRAASAGAPRLLPDAGNLLLALLLLWGYLTLMQLVTIWIANLPDEIRWFVPRLQTDWRSLGLVWLVLLPGLALPLLLSRHIKTRPGGLALAAGTVLLGQVLYTLWLTLPTLRPAGLRFSPLDLAVLAGAGALWLAAFVLHLVLNRPATVIRRDRAIAAPLDVRRHGGVPAVRDEVAWTSNRPPLPTGALARPPGAAVARTAEPAARPSVSVGPRGSTVLAQESGGIAAGTVVRVVAAIGVLLIGAASVLLPWRHQQGGVPRPPESGPVLLANPVANLAEFRAAQRAGLEEWGWVSREDGIARIPVRRAIEMLIARGQAPTSPGEERQ